MESPGTSIQRFPWLDDLAQDVRYGFRTLRRTPVFTAVALVTLALGIGANTAVFSIVNAVILQPLLYPKPEQLVRLTADFPLAGSSGVGLSHPEYEEFRRLNKSFAEMGVFTAGRANTGGGSGAWAGEVNLTAGDRPLRVRSAAIDDHLLGALGIEPAQGRPFAAGETDAMAERPGLGGPPLAILSHELWQSAFGGEPMVGRAVNIDGRPHDVIGIMPPGADVIDNRTEIWLPLGIHPVTRQIRDAHLLAVIGRLKDGVTLQAAQAELDAFLQNWGERSGTKGHSPTARPSRPQDHTVRMQPLQEAIVGDSRRAIWLLQAAVALVLLIACANMANLVIARAETRRGEFAVRTALGAGLGRMVRQTVTEGALLSMAGGFLGVWLARASVRALVLLYPASLPRTSEIGLDTTVLLFALAVSLATGILFGFAPIARSQVSSLVSTLRQGGDRGATAGRLYVRRILVAGEVALAVMLVVGAGLLIRTLQNLTQVDAGFDRSRLVTFSMTLPRATKYPVGRAGVYQRLLETLRSTRGVEAATAMSDLPLNRHVQGYNTVAENYRNTDGRPVAIVDYYQFVMSDYFDTMGIPIVAGRSFVPSDTLSENRVAIVNETLARRLWPGLDPIGRRITPNLSASIGTSRNPGHTVIGVARDVKEGGVDQEPGAELYLFIDQPGPPIDGSEKWVTTAPPTMQVALRTNLPPAALSQALTRAVHGADPAVPIVRLRDMDAVFAESIRRPRLLAQLLGAFAGLALLLAAIGTYGVLSFMVAERRREIGIRLALGAARSTVLASVMKQGLGLTIAGVAAGLAGAIGLNRLIASLLFGVQPTDPMTMIAVTVTITLVAAFACWLPAWRASRLDPNIVLQAE